MTPDLDIEQPGALTDYLRQTARIPPDESPRTEILQGGVSNRTVLVSRTTGESWVVKQALAKLRVAVEWFSDPRRIEREALGLKHLAEIAPPGTITPLIFEDPAHHLLAMQAVPQPHDNWKSLLLAGRIVPDHVQQFARLLATLHRRSYERRVELGQLFADRTFFETLRIEPYYRYTARQVPETYSFFKQLILDTSFRQLTLVHGDYSPKNVLVKRVDSSQESVVSSQMKDADHGGAAAPPSPHSSFITHHSSFSSPLVLLDHEVIHFGDPAFDLGFSLTHFLAKGHHLPAHRAAFADAARLYWRTYRETLGEFRWTTDLEEFAVRHTLAILLARVAGRSPLEYLTPDQRAWQQAVVVQMMAGLPDAVDELIETFLDRE
jgi:aminoglycoside phosphotransferase (APT) family kinase protein